jgi:F-type H+-transporting ATPase subunit delta
MKPNRKAKKYAEALLTVSKELDCIPRTGKSLRIIDQLVKQEKVFRAFFYTQRINHIEKASILKAVLGDLINPAVYEFFGLLAEQNEYQLFMSVTIVYAKLQKEFLNQIDVTTYSIDKIDQETISSIVKGIERSTGKKVELSSQTDKELLGGLKLRIGNTIFDGTIANQMAKMKKVLLQNY